jgi:hypothetical protein
MLIDQLMTAVSAVANAATTNEIGQAEAYKTAVIFSHSPGDNAAPLWLANLTANIQQIANLTQQNTANIQQIANSTQQNTDNIQQITDDLANLTGQLWQIANDVAFLRQRTTEQPIILANSQAGPRGPLYNPTIMLAQGWAPLLAAPNPRTRDELLVFTGEIIRFLSQF